MALLVLLLAAGGLVFYFAYGVNDVPPEHVTIEGLSKDVEIAWRDDASIGRIRADSLQDAYAALGFVHGARRTWTTILWRNTALGRLGEWFGDEVLQLDSLARQLGFAEFARRTYADLPGEQKTLLEAYARGMNGALHSKAVQQGSPLVLLDREALPWEPWHTLAVERLFAWMAAPPLSPDETVETDNAAMGDFIATNRHLHRWLATHGFSHSMAFVVEDSVGAHFLQRQVHGASAVPAYQEVVIETSTHPPLLAASLPGTPFFPAGRAGERAWAILPSSAPTLEWVAYDSSAVIRSHERLLGPDGTEHLLAVRRTSDALLIGTPTTYTPPDTLADSLEADASLPEEQTSSPPADSIWQVRWNGFEEDTDFDAWQTLLEGRIPSFQLLEGDGLTMDSTGTHQVLGQPQVTERFSAGLVVGNTFWTEYIAEQLRTLADPDGRAAFSSWIDNDSSAWAAETAPLMLASLDSLARMRGDTLASEERTGVFNEALTYLRNWDFRYDRASIGASIYDTWLAEYRRQAGSIPPLLVADTMSYTENLLRYRTLERAVASLANDFGQDLRQWRWENVVPDERYFPGWSSDTLSLAPFREMSRTRYSPIRLPGRGHPSALSWGPSPVEANRPSPAAWEAWISTASWNRLQVRRRDFNVNTFLGRYRIPERRPDPITIDTVFAPDHTTTLVPPAP